MIASKTTKRLRSMLRRFKVHPERRSSGSA
jgi:hypothetical protein